MLLETAIFDAYGAGFEFESDEFIAKHNDLKMYRPHPLGDLAPGRFTDDTLMSIWVARTLSLADYSLTHVDGQTLRAFPVTPLRFAEEFVQGYKRDSRSGFAKHFQAFMNTVTSAKDFLTRIDNRSNRSGGAMRAGPCGLLSSPRLVREAAEMQASLTHNTRDGLAAAAAAALMVHYFAFRLGVKEDLGDFLNLWCGSEWHDWNKPWTGRVGTVGWMPVLAAITAIKTTDSLSKCLRTCIAFGGDTDTTAAIAGAAASWCGELERDLPWGLINSIEPLSTQPGGEQYSDYDKTFDRASKRPWHVSGDDGIRPLGDRASGVDMCEVCKKAYADHMHSTLVPWCIIRCDGRSVYI